MAALHQRQIIRDAVVAQLMRKTDAEDRVFKTREIPLKRTELPAICVYTLEETVDAESRRSSPRYLTRTLQLGIEITVKATDDLDDAIDAMALQVERAMDADPNLGADPAAQDSVLISTQIGVDVTGDKPIGLCRMAYSVFYETPAPDPADLAALPDFSKANTETSLSGEQATADRAKDNIAVPIT